MGWLTRFLGAVTFLAVGVIFSPETFGSKSDGEHSSKLTAALKLAHLLCFATAWGAALWVTFIGGIIMFKNLPRHQFGNLQSKMFPAYFSMVGLCCAVSTASFGYLHPWKSSSSAEKYQLGFLLSAFAFNLTNLLVFTPMTIEMMKQRHKVEREQNIGEEIGWSKNQEVAKVNPKLAAMNKKFGMIHGLSSLANIMSFGSLAMHSWYLAVTCLVLFWCHIHNFGIYCKRCRFQLPAPFSPPIIEPSKEENAELEKSALAKNFKIQAYRCIKVKKKTQNQLNSMPKHTCSARGDW